jgi:peroxiredoxin
MWANGGAHRSVLCRLRHQVGAGLVLTEEQAELDHKTFRHWLMFLLALGFIWVALRLASVEVNSAGGGSSPLPRMPAAVAADFVIGPRTGSLAPDFTLETLDGGMVSLSDLRGQVALINFWATWCPPCREEMPAIQNVYDRYRDQGFTVLAVNLLETNAEVAAFAEELGLTFSILMDRQGQVLERYRVRGLPTTFFVDRTGVVQNVKVGGPMSEDFIEGQVTDLLAAGEKIPDAIP